MCRHKTCVRVCVTNARCLIQFLLFTFHFCAPCVYTYVVSRFTCFITALQGDVISVSSCICRSTVVISCCSYVASLGLQIYFSCSYVASVGLQIYLSCSYVASLGLQIYLCCSYLAALGLQIYPSCSYVASVGLSM